MEILGMILLGLVAGAVAKLLMPGDDPGGIIATIVLGIAGSLVGGFLANSIGWGEGARFSGFIGSVIGAIALLAIYRVVLGARHSRRDRTGRVT